MNSDSPSTIDASVRYKLTNLNDNHTIAVVKDKFKIGRAPTNDISIAANRYLSSSHCILEYVDGHVYISDTSSNGTLINRSLKITKTDPRIQLTSGDVIHLVFRKDLSDDNVVFQIELSSKNTKQISAYDEDTQPFIDLSIPPISPIETNEKPTKEFAMDAEEDMEDVLTCVCCQDIMTNPICLEPCLHAFCDECYTSWEAVQRTCPKCRVKVTGKKKNVVINGILEAFLKAFPQKRPAPKIKEDQTKSKYQIGPDGMYLHNTQDEDMEYDDDDDDNDEADDDNQVNFNGFFAPVLHAAPQPATFRCRQCPNVALWGGMPTPVGFQCPPGQNHILCQCCLQPMPDRRDEANIHQNCEMCHQFLCNMYFQPCSRQGCLGCLNHFRDFHFGPNHLNNLVNNNPVETQIVQDYLTYNQLTMQDFFILCCNRLDQGIFKYGTMMETASNVPSSKIVCYKCAVRIFQDLAYQFRVQMKQNEIHSLVLRNRQDCHYGKRCRTQFNKIAHAQRFNHACEQSRF